MPYTRVRSAAIEPLPAVALRDVSGSDEALYELWVELWASGLDFVVVEHDIVIHAGVLPAFADCPSPWCTFGYEYILGDREPIIYHGSGCTRFRGELTQAVPDALERVGRMSNERHPERHWCTVDGFLQHVLETAGITPCRHEPPVAHLDPYVSHDCWLSG